MNRVDITTLTRLDAYRISQGRPTQAEEFDLKKDLINNLVNKLSPEERLVVLEKFSNVPSSVELRREQRGINYEIKELEMIPDYKRSNEEQKELVELNVQSNKIENALLYRGLISSALYKS